MEASTGTDELSTVETEITQLSTPTALRPRPLTHSLSLRSLSHHSVQCGCDQTFTAVLTRHFSFLGFKREKKVACRRLQEWAEKCVPQHGERTYTNLLISTVDTKDHRSNLHQVEIDLSRTYPDEPYFSEGSAGRAALRRLLTAFSTYDPALGYVQGMNFIAAALLWHAEEVAAFWLLVHLMEDYELRDNYSPSLPGLSKHSQIVNLILIEHLPRLHLLFCKYRIGAELFVTDWCFTLFGSMVPLGEMGVVLERFFEGGWSFFYKVVLVILGRLQYRLLQSTDISDLLSSLRPPNKSQRRWHEFVSNLERGRESLNWERLLQEALQQQIDDRYIQRLHFGFCLDTSRFGLLE